MDQDLEDLLVRLVQRREEGQGEKRVCGARAGGQGDKKSISISI
jgi:putative lipoic acid-binding regulatory protein